MVRILHRITIFSLIVILGIGLSNCSLQPTFTADAIVKSTNDSRDYRSLVLPNQLKVLLISDPDADKAAAALDVHVGSSANPKERQGLAHFLEHMLFLGTEKYPDTGEYQRFISEHGGSHNAFTAFEHTNYFFDVDTAYLEPTLDRFAQFFIAPLFNAEFVEREKHAVDSEYQSKLKDDGRRQYEVLKSIANPEHPFAEFFVGSLDTLADRPGRAVRDDLIEFYNRYYSANLMSLVVLGNQSLEELEHLVRTKFGAVPNRQSQALEISQPLFDKNRLPLSIAIEPVKDVRRLSIQFPLPSLYPYYLSKPTHYLANLLGHEGNGSLLSYLKQQGWADSLSAGIGHNASDSATFHIGISLTAEGLQHRDEIIEAVFSQIEQIRSQGLNEWRFKEQQQLAQMEFDFKEKGSGVHYVTTLASQLQHYPVRDLLQAPYIFAQYRPGLIADLLKRMTPENMVVITSTQELETDKFTEWFKAPYSVQPISAAQLQRWRQPEALAQLKLPPPNPFIAEGLSIITSPEKRQPPQQLQIDNHFSLWHSQDTSFGTPRADFFFAIRSTKANDTAAHRLLTELYVKAVNDQLSEFSYPAYLAGLNYRLYQHVRGLTVRISGYQDKQEVLLREISKTLKSPNISQERFAIFKDEISRDLDNAEKDRPYNQALDKVSKLILTSGWEEKQLKQALAPLTLADLKAFIPRYLSEIELVALANGNIDAAEAKAMALLLKDTFLGDTDTGAVKHQPVIRLDKDQQELYALTVNHPDSAIVNYIQGDDRSVTTAARFALFNQLLSAPFYEELRTVQQRGYIVFATSMAMMDVPATALVIQSPNTSATDLSRLIDDFLKKFNEQIQAMTEADFLKHQNALITRILEKETRLSQLSSRYWHEIDRENYRFDRRERLADTVASFSLEQFKQDYVSYLLGSNKRSLTVIANGERFPFSEQSENKYSLVNSRKDLPQSYF